jgi:transcription initiation factor TFIIIB Brf1 subunit/transcription initiation factor TFIIB
MKYEKIKKYKDEKFRRITGVKRPTFERLLEILKAAYDKKHKKRGRHSKLTVEDMLLATLEYLREYRTYAHIAASYDIDESNIYRLIKWVENTLIKDGTFRLPGKAALLTGEIAIELKDVTESPIERPKKKGNVTVTTQAKNGDTQKKG